ncbi:UDP-N-acetylmuramate:L-alanyl-gamma-D-glutamyl-meso-diaminopimelate ligase [Thioalkalivibrio sp. HK1]|uniref:UDP-N-acetylmuramate:L-alanyl-gamma-D-glutamyl- meso-diaminopimelate ligase n=1 Tax=Thioalkalivibrio sp. HK1 TaxID=1469245 RepID=UPI00046F02FC|nr:UDP-N-acetylmuramate:L-alanyl-gamma-D-glutamyl-meso-diaminopimelate ligase [Thioalkalivibrio sp. HK1]
MHIHFLGICGTFMAGLALLAKEMGHRVSGADRNIYPPMSDLLDAEGIVPIDGYDPAQLRPAPDLVIVGNALGRGNPCVEAILERDLRHTSGPAWLHDRVLPGRHVIAVAGTHGKTTTSAMIAHILGRAGLDPGFLIGGLPARSKAGARLGSGGPHRVFVIEADEYDTAFFDKRSKFIHYRPRTLVLNNLEFDHADIFDDLAAIKRQFHHLIRIVPGPQGEGAMPTSQASDEAPLPGKIIAKAEDAALDEVLKMGCWTSVERFGIHDEGCKARDPQGQRVEWSARSMTLDGRRFELRRRGRPIAEIAWDLRGEHNISNAVAAIAAASHVGIDAESAARAIAGFPGVKRRLEHRATIEGVALFDDFAHHPTAIEASIRTLRSMGFSKVIAVLELASNSMRAGAHDDRLPICLARADMVRILAPTRSSSPDEMSRLSNLAERSRNDFRICDDIKTIVDECGAAARQGDAILVMSNAGFAGIQERLVARLQSRS